MPADRVFGLDREAAIKGRAGGYDAQRVIEHDQRLADGIDDAVGIGARGLDFPFGRFQLRYIGERDDDALNVVVCVAMRQEASVVPGAVIGFDLSPKGDAGGDHRLDVEKKVAIDEVARDLRERAAEIGRGKREQGCCRGCEEAKRECAVDDEGRNAGAVEDGLEIFGARKLRGLRDARGGS